jgi:peptidoglycan glycosyltransferase
MYSALGYYSLRYGEGGAEAAFDDILNGDARAYTFEDFVYEGLLHRTRQGADVRLTFDLDVQNQIASLMAGYQGAVVVIAVPDGEVIAMLSLPTYDPNLLDNNWDSLIEDEGDPFFNRALQGDYLPGSSAYTILVAAALAHDIDLDSSFVNAGDPVVADDLILNCAVEPPSDTLSLAAAYRYGCPRPFVDLNNWIGLADISSTFDQFLPEPPFTLSGFVSTFNDDDGEATVLSQPFTIEDALGQGRTTLTPLQLAAITAAIINHGDAPRPYALRATRQPESDRWVTENVEHSTVPIMSPQIAQQLGSLMRGNVGEGSASSWADDNIDVGWQTALAYSGEESHVWFTGFAQESSGASVVVTAVIEASDDLDLAVRIGSLAVQAAIGAH